MSDKSKLPLQLRVISNSAGHRNLRLWNLLNQASEIIDDIEITLRIQRDRARETARAAADATSPEAVRLIELVREMHSNALEDGNRGPANLAGSASDTEFPDNIIELRAGDLVH